MSKEKIVEEHGFEQAMIGAVGSTASGSGHGGAPQPFRVHAN